MNRRDFMTASVATAGLAVTPGVAQAQDDAAKSFKLKYAPHFGMFENSAGNTLAYSSGALLSFAEATPLAAWPAALLLALVWAL